VRTIDVVYRFDLARRLRRNVPRTPAEALRRLERGHRAFAGLLDSRRRARIIPLDPSDVGYGARPGHAPAQRPFAAVIGCSDARVPIEMVFQQRANDLFVVRVAGNGLGSGCLGSLRYAAAHFSQSLRLVLVLGHSQCGAVTAAVDAFLRPKDYLALAANYPLRAIVDSILVAVRSASLVLEAVHSPRVTGRPGYRAALVETSAILNAGLAAYSLKQEIESPSLRVVFGSYELGSRSVRLASPPRNDEEFRRLAKRVARSASIRALLDPSGSVRGKPPW
jgi:carbonic anhydrase